MNETVETITAVQALGVALSIPAGTMTMPECQDAAPAMLEHLQAMGFDIVRRDLARALAESEERVRVLETALGTVLLRLEDALTVQKAGCNHNGIGRPGCRVCDPRTWTDADVARAALSEPETPR